MKTFILLFTASWVPFVAGICVRRPTVDCSDVLDFTAPPEGLQYCQDDLLTCQVIASEFCRDTDRLTDPQCEDIVGVDNCTVYDDCLFVSDNIGLDNIQGPYHPDCNVRSVLAAPGSFSSFNFFDGSIPDDFCMASFVEISQNNCGLDGTAVAGRWLTVQTRVAMSLRLTATMDDNVPVRIAVFDSSLNPVLLNCLVNSDDDDDEPASTTDVVVNAVPANRFLFVLVTTTSNSTTPVFGEVAYRHATATSACAYECDRFITENATCTCGDPDPTTGQVLSKVVWLCEECSGPQCVRTRGQQIYAATGGEGQPLEFCYDITQGGNTGDTVCTTYSLVDGTATEYSLNGTPCVTMDNPDCAFSATFDCSALVPGAVFDWCEPDGYVGPFAPVYWLAEGTDLTTGECGIFTEPPTVTPGGSPTAEPSSAFSVGSLDPTRWCWFSLAIFATVAPLL